MSIPAEAQEAIQKAGDDTKEFMETFSKEYLISFVKMKVDGAINDVVSTALPGAPDLSVDDAMGGDDAGGDDAGGDDAAATDDAKDGADGVEAKDDDEKPIAAGVSLINFKLLTGPDKQPHRYYSIAGVAVYPNGSVISRVNKTHRALAGEAANLAKLENAPKVPFPKKKRMGKKEDAYYKARFSGMADFYKEVNKSKVSESDQFLKAFSLRADPDRADRLEVFQAALEPVAEDKGIDLEGAMERAEDIGIAESEPDLLKVVALDCIAKPQSETVATAVQSSVPGFLPQKVKNRVVKAADTSLNTVVGTAIDTSWVALGPAFDTVAQKIGEVLDKGIEPIKTVLMAGAEPLGKVVKDKFKIGGDEPEPSTGREIDLNRYPWIAEVLADTEGGKGVDAIAKLEKKVGGFKKKEDYAGYLTYDFGPDWVKDLQLPYVDEVSKPHEHLVGALLDAWAVLSLGGVKAMKPLFKYCDETSANFDGNTFKEGLADAVREGGLALAKDYFDLPRTLKKATKHLGAATTKVVLTLARKTVQAEVDMLGQIAAAWNPQNAGEVKPQFLAALVPAATKWGTVTASRFVTTVRNGTQLAFVKIAMDEMGGAIDDVTGTLDGVVGNLPDPLPEYLKPGDLCKSIMDKMIFKAAFFGTKKISKPTEDTFYNVGGVRKTILAVPKAGDNPDKATDDAAKDDMAEAAEAAAQDAAYNTSDDDVASPRPAADGDAPAGDDAAPGAADGDDA